MWCLSYCIEKVQISKIDRLYKIAQILFEISRLFFTHTRTHDWSEEFITTAHTLLSTWRIEWEEYNEPSGSIPHHVASETIHITNISLIIYASLALCTFKYQNPNSLLLYKHNAHLVLDFIMHKKLSNAG